MKDEMMLYGVTLALRHTRQQKQVFFDQVNELYRRLGYQVRLQAEASRFSAVNNIVIGDLKKAKTIVAAAYDTPSKIKFFSVNYYPFAASKNVRIEVLYSLFQLLISSLAFFGLYYLLKGWADYLLIWKIGSIVLGLIIAVFMYWLMKAGANPVNFNRNSAALAIIDVLAHDRKLNDVAFILLDGCVNGYRGYKVAQPEIKASQRVIILDALAAGERVVVAHRPTTDVSCYLRADNLKIQDKVYESELADANQLAFFPNGLVLASGTVKNKQFIVKNTRNKRDIELDIERLTAIADLIKEDITGSISSKNKTAENKKERRNNNDSTK